MDSGAVEVPSLEDSCESRQTLRCLSLPIDSSCRCSSPSRSVLAAQAYRVEVNPELEAKWEAQHAEDNNRRAQSFKRGEDEVTPIESVHGL
ncbi:MAG TPA: hypothetical protein ENK31_04235 [Nannocystis exedens]|nr:hypothetical protein [Nannocystis exedens]